MCGIYGFIGEKAVREVMKGIKRLEYRGYDSAGIAFIGKYTGNNEFFANFSVYDSGLVAIKEKGQVDRLEKIVENVDAGGEIAIGHTRWATHGKPSIENSHPHLSSDGQWAVVHNGIIENYSILKEGLCDYNFKSQTDSEVVCALMERCFDGDPLGTLVRVCKKLKGSYALGVVYAKEPDKIFVARQNSPVVVGCTESSGIVCSDINSLGSASKAFVLENGQFAIVERGKIAIFNQDLKEIELESVDIEEIEGSNLGEYQHFMLKEINEIPLAIEKTVCQYNGIEKFEKALPKREVEKIKKVILIGCGTAYHACLMGGEILEKECKLPASCFIASEFETKEFLWREDTLAIFVSQSGETADTLKALKRCKEKGLKTLALTNVKNSSICMEAQFVLYTSAGSEIAVASTKAYNSQVALFHMLGGYIKTVKEGLDDNILFNEYQNLCKVADIIEKTDIHPVCKEIAEKIKDSQSIYMIGRGDDYRTAMEASLKLKEISYIHCEAYPAGELKHGTISLITPQTYVFAFVTCEATKDKSFANISEVSSRGGKVILLSSFDINELKGGFDRLLLLPKVSEKYMPLIAVVYMQLIAYYTSLSLGLNPDKPRSLAKSVTVE